MPVLDSQIELGAAARYRFGGGILRRDLRGNKASNGEGEQSSGVHIEYYAVVKADYDNNADADDSLKVNKKGECTLSK